MTFNNRLEKITTRIFIGIFILFFITIFVRLTTKVFIKLTGISNSFTKVIFFDQTSLDNGFDRKYDVTDDNIAKDVNWSNSYPFKDTEDSSIKIQQDDDNFYLNFINKVKNILNVYSSDYLVFRSFFTELESKIEKSLNWNMVNPNNNVFILDNEYLVGIQKKVDTQYIADSIKRLNNFCNSKDIPFVYFQAPSKIADNEKQVLDFSNDNINNLLNIIDVYDVPYIDFRVILNNTNYNHYDFFYKTDPHWKVETGLYAAYTIMQYIKDTYIYDIDLSVYDSSMFEKKLIENNFLGAYGRIVTLGKTNLEDFTIILPTYPSNFDFIKYSSNKMMKHRNGDFQVLIDFSQFRNGDYYNRSCYHSYLWNNQISFIKNYNSNNNKKILVIGDSFSDVVVPYISLAVERCDYLDPRDFDGSFESYLEKNNFYDAVIILLSPQHFADYIEDNTHNNLYDYR